MRNRELEARLVDRLDDDETWSGYADWLQSHGDPRGEVVAVAMRAETARDKFGRDDYQLLLGYVGRFASLHSVIVPSRTYTKKLEGSTVRG